MPPSIPKPSWRAAAAAGGLLLAALCLDAAWAASREKELTIEYEPE